MAQRPTADFNIDPNITSGTDLANILNRFQDAIDSGNSGASRPAYLDAGGLWVQTGNPMRLFFYDGTSDRELFNTTDGIISGIDDGTEAGQVTAWDGSAWKPNSSLKINSGNATFSGNVLMPTGYLENRSKIYNIALDTSYTELDASTGTSLLRGKVSSGQYSYILEANTGNATFFGKVGIGMTPAMRLKAWQEEFEARMKAEPKANKKAVTLEITGNAFEVLPTEAKLAEWMETRAAGDALQVDGNGSFTGTVNASSFFRPTRGGITFAENSLLGINKDNQITATGIELGNDSQPFSDGHFSGTVNADILHCASGRLVRKTGDCGIIVSGEGLFACDSNGVLNKDAEYDLGSDSDRWKDAFLSGTVKANQFYDANGPIISAFTMVEAFRKIKNAVADETTVEGIKESLTNALGGLIEEFESIGTQES